MTPDASNDSGRQDPRPLSETLRRATRDLHAEAESTGLMARLLEGATSPAEYGSLVAALLPIYEALEEGLKARESDPLVGPFWNPRLARASALATDLADLVEAGIRVDRTRGQRAGTPLADRIREIAQDDPVRLGAHAYVRYLGDLAGGRMLGRALSSVLDLPGSAGTAFYRFPPELNVGSEVRRIRAALDSIPASDHDAVVSEARESFRLHIRLFQDLDSPAARP